MKFNLDEKKYKIIPETWSITKLYSFSFEGWTVTSIDANDESFSILSMLLKNTIDKFIDLHKKKYAFTQPLTTFKYHGIFSVKIGVMEIKEYKKRMSKQKIKDKV